MRRKPWFDRNINYVDYLRKKSNHCKPDPDTGTNLITIVEAGQDYVDLLEKIYKLQMKVENQKYHIKKLHHQNQCFKSELEELRKTHIIYF